MEVIAFTNLKGGTAKSTSSAFVAHAYAAQGKRVLVVDADPQGSTVNWSAEADWSIPTLALPVKNLHTRLPGIIPPGTDAVIIDTPPLEEQAGIVHAAMRAANKIIITMAPTMMEFARLAQVWNAIEDTEPLRQEPAVSAVLLNRTVSPDAVGAVATYRQLIRDDGRTVLDTGVRQHQILAQAYGAPITELREYAAVADEIANL